MGIGLAPPAAALAVRPVHLDHTHPLAVKRAGEAGAVGAGPLDTDLFHVSEAPQPVVEGPVAGVVSNDSTPNSAPW